MSSANIQATDEHLSMMDDLRKCTFQVGSFDKRFVRNVSALINSKGLLTPKQAALIYTLHYRYRRQHGKITPHYDVSQDLKAHRNKNQLEDQEKLKAWNEASKR